MKKNICASVFLLFLSLPLIAQQSAITIKDKTSGLPVSDVIYIYGNERGYSDTLGRISLKYIENISLLLSHITYNTLIIKGDELNEAFMSGFTELEYSSPIMLSSVAVYAVRETKSSQSVKLENSDWVHHDAGQVLQNIPGFDAVRKSMFGYDPVYRGFKLDQLNIIYDGAMGATAACPNRMDPPSSQIAINQVSEIEVIRGPHSFRYGPSMGATINFKPAPPSFSDSLRAFGRVSSGFESNGEVYRNEGQAGIRNRNSETALTGSYSKGNNYTAGGGDRISAGFSRGTIGLAANFKTARENTVSFTANRNFARNADFPTLPMDLLSDDTWMMQAMYKASGNNKWHSGWNSQVYSSFVDHRMSNSFRNPAMVLASTAAKTRNIGGRTEITLKSRRSVAYLGIDVKYENISGDRIRTMLAGPNEGKAFTDYVWQDGQLMRGGAFADWMKEAGKYKFSFSGRIDVVNGRPKKPAETFLAQYSGVEETDINPSMSAGISRQWTKGWFAGLWLGRGMRSAGITERFINSLPVGKDPYEMMGNPNLKAEANNQADLLVSFRNERSFIEFSAYYSIVDHFITSVITPEFTPKFGAPGVRQFRNIDMAHLYGFDFSWQQELASVFFSKLRLIYTMGENMETNMPLPEISPFSIRYNLEARLFRNMFKPYVTVQHSMAQNRIAADFGERATDAFIVADAGISLIIFKSIISSVAINNIFDLNYREHLSRFINAERPLYSPGRSLVINFSVDF